MIELGPRFGNPWRGYPTRFSPSDYNLWKKWIEIHWREYEGFYFDVRIMSDEVLPEGIEENFRRMWQINRARKIDAIGIQKDKAVIIEFRDFAGLSVIGQISGYKALLIIENPFDLPLEILVVTNSLEKNVADALYMLKIPVEIIPL